ncbi:SCO family protein [Verminephrobacter aporrectodeae]|uniref:SCO family protein n=1 Tax=Verminephrobacter aporrectodeae subsp. tuberculatae TaxID=1110392 RepID=A0ABT3KWW0_9BURK|nr:SCO family protein [Verminephrobacter aporrectodeae]MCW5258047.1 SCO family protein [Verminephrobacter aporrectodeae subsp. tuberculatae]MCW5322813.1 SCO family protein [Verminephrobacter aporrectodeae subsp. tuberculatae]MCW8176710.1 SCO family protein [Verminephrobacter aporrectodeae subsp. tuberculatae]MCW8199760.1 SCO family protein [Verminephrobacter aporrectodeae subsp. tuberculatae]MCW8203769.1 SCO family protein [Verminephrobacter aporrectodeae subsp. tuberculatae]
MGIAGLIGACSGEKAQFRGVDITGIGAAQANDAQNAPNFARDLGLTDHNGQVRPIRDFAGKVVIVFFGYTQCPDVCPTSLQELAQAKQLLGRDGERMQGIFVTVDPERDTPEVLKAYMANFDPGFLALRGTPEQLAQVARDFKIYYKKAEGKTPTSYTMDHSAGSYMYDPAGHLRIYHRYGSGAQALAADAKILLGKAG